MFVIFSSVAISAKLSVSMFIRHIRSSSSLLSIVSDDDISVGFRPLCALLVGERIDQFEI